MMQKYVFSMEELITHSFGIYLISEKKNYFCFQDSQFPMQGLKLFRKDQKQGSLTYTDGKEKLNLQSPKKNIFTKIGMCFHWK